MLNRAGLHAALLFAAVAVLHWPTVFGLARIYADSATYGHGWVVWLLALWLIYERGSAFDDSARPSIFGALLLAVSALGWLIVQLAEFQTLAQIALPAVALSTIWAARGRHAALATAAPLSLLLLALPIWDVLRPTLQAITAQVSAQLASLAGVPVMVEGSQISVPAGVFVVAEGCSGLNFLLVAVSLGSVLALINRGSLSIRLALIAGAVALALLANWMRVAILVIVGQETAMRHAWVADEHYGLGWLLFVLFILPYLYAFGRLSEKSATKRSDVAAKAHQIRAPVSGVAVLIGSALPWLWYSVNAAGSADLPITKDPLHEITPGWRLGTRHPAEWRPVFAGADMHRAVRFCRDLRCVDSDQVLYAGERQGHELIAADNRIEGEEPWTLEHRVSAPEGFAGFVASDGTRQRVVWYQFGVGARVTAHSVVAKLTAGVLRLTGRQPPCRATVLSTECMGDCEKAADLLLSFATDRRLRSQSRAQERTIAPEGSAT